MSKLLKKKAMDCLANPQYIGKIENEYLECSKKRKVLCGLVKLIV